MAQRGINPDLYIITPFVIVQDNLRKVIRESGVLNGWTDDPRAWTGERVGTVHVVQGREAEAVIFVLGAPAPQQIGARGWAGGRPNLLNVAVTRAKEALYVVGNRRLWREAGFFRELDVRLQCEGASVRSAGQWQSPGIGLDCRRELVRSGRSPGTDRRTGRRMDRGPGRPCTSVAPVRISFNPNSRQGGKPAYEDGEDAQRTAS